MGYAQAAYLINSMRGASNFTQQAADQYAAWGIFVDGAHSGTYINSLMGAGYNSDPIFTSYFNTDSATTYGESVQTGMPGGWDVVTFHGAGAPVQEFLTPAVGDFAPTPEPFSIVLLGTACLAFTIYARKRAKRSTSVA